MAKKPIETVADAQRRARRRVPRPVYTALISGNQAGVTMNANVSAFDKIGFRPRAARETPEETPLIRDLSSSVLGIPISFPVICGPVGAQAVDPRSEVAVAAASRRAGTAFGLSSFGARPIEEVMPANENTFYQLYWTGSRDDIAFRVERARKAGAKGLIVTLDATGGGLGPRDWGAPSIPSKLDLAAMLKFAPLGVSRPAWLARFLLGGGLPDMTIPNSASSATDKALFANIYGTLMQTPVPTWKDVEWIRELWGGKFVVKGIWRSDDALRAIDAGADAVAVSNHGGNNLDTTPATIRVLNSVATAVGQRAELWMDGGVRRGSDVAKALALGADVVALGRAWLWGLAAGGEEGVYQVLEIHRTGLERALVGLGHSSIKDLSIDDLEIPEGFLLKA